MTTEPAAGRDPADGAHRRLVLFRHAKSSYPSGVPDHDRPLAGKGRRNAFAAGEWFVHEGPRPDLVVCSDAVRARHTWEIVAGCLAESVAAPPVVLEPRLYGADPDDLLAVARSTDPGVRTLVLVGHEPTLSATTALLSGEGSDPTALSRVLTKFPTGGIAVLRFTGAWSAVAPGCAALELFAVPRA